MMGWLIIVGTASEYETLFTYRFDSHVQIGRLGTSHTAAGIRFSTGEG